MTPKRDIPPIHPGEILREEFLGPLEISQYRLAKAIQVPPRRINEIVLEKRGISADTALRLAKFLGTTPQFWLNMQTSYEMEHAFEALRRSQILAQIRPHAAAS